MSELLGYVLLVGIVMTGAVAIVIFGASAIGGLQEQQDAEATQTMMQEVDSRLATLSTASESRAVGFSFAETDQTVQRSPDLVTDSGYVNVTVNGNGTCSANVSLDSIRLEDEAGTTIVYEAGGVWRLSENGAASIVTPPTVSVQDGQVSLSLTNMTGSVAAEDNQAILNATSSAADSTTAMNQLLQGDCQRPDNVTVRIQSDMYQAWGEHLAGETGYDTRSSPPAGSGSYLVVNDGTETATIRLNQSALPERTNDAKNNVVDVTNASYMDDVTVTSDGISVSKDANNSYTVYAEPVADDIEIGSVQKISSAENITRPPLDVVFVVDESGSMADPSPGTGGDRKYEDARQAMRTFTTYLDDGDRVGLVGFRGTGYNRPYRAHTFRSNGRILTGDFGKFHSTTNKTTYNSNTYTATGMRRANEILNTRSNASRNKYIVMLTDGKNEGYNQNQDFYINGNIKNGPDDATKRIATLAHNSGTTVFTIGFGSSESDLNPGFLNQTALNGGGEYYYAANASALESAFESLSQQITSTKQVGHLPLSTNLSSKTAAYPPQITGNVDDIANVTTGNNTFLNVNDPTAPSTFSHAFTVSEGDMVNFSAMTGQPPDWGCDNWVSTGQTTAINGTDGTESAPVTRCARMNKSGLKELGEDEVTVFTSEDATLLEDNLTNNWKTSEWQTNLTTVMKNRGLYNRTNGLTLESNQVIVAYDFPQEADSETDNIMLMLYTVGLSEESAKPSGIVDIDINNVRIEG
ncbi:VWA domain-containing protein [Halorhabdus sp. CBA1104]|uniref:vWA domain-containing protein n=1 Tax=Halorhabdus sp. CBA1104 TaxID=1380432 RepID=UPI0018A6B137|nr:vWA domain-containing protein [Halorhabdus sp. CBA1104]